MKKVRIAKKYGMWYYHKAEADMYNDLDAPIYTLYDADQKFVNEFGCYNDMISYCMYGIVLA